MVPGSRYYWTPIIISYLATTIQNPGVQRGGLVFKNSVNYHSAELLPLRNPDLTDLQDTSTSYTSGYNLRYRSTIFNSWSDIELRKEEGKKKGIITAEQGGRRKQLIMLLCDAMAYSLMAAGIIRLENSTINISIQEAFATLVPTSNWLGSYDTLWVENVRNPFVYIGYKIVHEF